MTTTAGGLEINSAYQANLLQAAQDFDTAYSSGKSTALGTKALDFSDTLSQTAIDANRSNDGKTNFAGLDQKSNTAITGALSGVNSAKSAGNFDEVDRYAKLVISAFGNQAPPASTVPTSTGANPTTLTGGDSGQLSNGPVGGLPGAPTVGTNTGTPTSTQTTNPIGDNPGLNTTGTTGASSVDSQVAQGVAAEHAATTVGDKSTALGSVLSTMMAGLSSPTTASPTTASPTTASPTTASPTTASPTTTSPTTSSPTTTGPVTGTNAPPASDPSMKVLQDGLNAINSLRSLADAGGGSSGKNNGVMGALDSLTNAAEAMFAARPQGGKPTDFAGLAKKILPELQNALAALAPGLSDTSQGRATMDQLANFLQELQAGISSQAGSPVAPKGTSAGQVAFQSPNSQTTALTAIYNQQMAAQYGLLAAIKNSQGA